MIPDLSVVWVVVMILVLAGVLNQLLFKPLTRVMHEREDAIKSAQQLAEKATTEAQRAGAEFDERTRSARAELYRAMDERRRAALDVRSTLLAQARTEAEASIKSAAERVHAQAAEARRTLERDAEGLAAAVTERVLGRRVS